MTEPFTLATLNRWKNSADIKGEHYNNVDNTVDWQYEMYKRHYDISQLVRSANYLNDL